MLIECLYCKSRVDAKVLAENEEFDPEVDPSPVKVTLSACPSCKNALVGVQEVLDVPSGEQWGPSIRVWPSPKRYIPWTVPPVVRNSLEEAERCPNAGPNTVAAAMSGRALEGICRHFKTKNRFLVGGIKELHDMGLIDKQFLQWSEELHKHRNIAAHAGDEQISKEDAVDLQDFAVAICEYVFVLTEKFNALLERKAKTSEKKKKT